MNIVNLTPHEINIYNEQKQLIRTISKSGVVARVSEEKINIGEFDGIPLFTTRFGISEHMPPITNDTIYIVSGIFRSAHPRKDVFQPGEAVKINGDYVGCIGLSQ